MTQVDTVGQRMSRAKRVVLGFLGGFLVLLVVAPPDFEAFMTVTGWSSELDGGAHKLHIIMRGFGSLVLGIGTGAVLILRPSWSLGVAYVWVAAAIAYPMAAILGLVAWPPAFIMPVISLVIVALVLWANRGQLPWSQPRERRLPLSRPILVATLVIAIPLIVYGLNEASLQRSPETLHGDLWHWAGSTMMALLIILMGACAALRHTGWRVPAWSAGVLLASFGAVSAALPNQASSAGIGWGLAAMVAAVGFVALAEYENRTAPITAPASSVQPARS